MGGDFMANFMDVDVLVLMLLPEVSQNIVAEFVWVTGVCDGG